MGLGAAALGAGAGAVLGGAAINAAGNAATGGMQLAAVNKTNQANKDIAESINQTNKENVAATNQANLDINKATNEANLEIAQMNNEYNQAQLEAQIKQQWDMWNAENAYNDPSAQMERFSKAGLNPYMASGNISSGNASSMTVPAAQPASPVTMQAAQMQAAHADAYRMQAPDLSGFRNIVGDFLNSIELQNRIESQQLDNQGKEIENQYKAKMFEANLNKMLADTDLAKSNKAYQDSAKRGLDTSNFFQPFMMSSELKQRETDRMFTSLRAQGQLLANLSALEWYKALPTQIQQEITSKAMSIKQQALTHDLTQAEINKKINEAVAEFYKGAREQQNFQFESDSYKDRLQTIKEDLQRIINNKYPSDPWQLSFQGGFGGNVYRGLKEASDVVPGFVIAK